MQVSEKSVLVQPCVWHSGIAAAEVAQKYNYGGCEGKEVVLEKNLHNFDLRVNV